MGQSDPPQGAAEYDLEEIFADLLAILEECSVDRVAVVGHDWGAVIAWGLVDRIGERPTCHDGLAL